MTPQDRAGRVSPVPVPAEPGSDPAGAPGNCSPAAREASPARPAGEPETSRRGRVQREPATGVKPGEAGLSDGRVACRDTGEPGRVLPSRGARPGQDEAPRTYTIALPAGLQLLSLNDRLHWRERYNRAQVIKNAACVTARCAKVPRLGRARIAVEYQPPDLRHRDADNPVASAKAAVDGIVMAGVLEDDECPRYVTGIWCTIGPLYPKGRLVLRVTEEMPESDGAS